MTTWREDQLNDVRDEKLFFQFRDEGVLVKSVQVYSALMQDRVGA